MNQLVRREVILMSHHEDGDFKYAMIFIANEKRLQNPVSFQSYYGLNVAQHQGLKRPIHVENIVDAIDIVQSYWMEKGQLVDAHDIVTLLAKINIKF